VSVFIIAVVIGTMIFTKFAGGRDQLRQRQIEAPLQLLQEGPGGRITVTRDAAEFSALDEYRLYRTWKDFLYLVQKKIKAQWEAWQQSLKRSR